MMGYYGNWGGYNSMMGGGFSIVFGFIIIIDLILLGIWLYKQINK